MSSFEEAKTLISEFNTKLTEFKNLKAAMANNIAKDFSKVIEGYLIEYKIPFVILMGGHRWNDGDTTYFRLETEHGYEDGVEEAIYKLERYFPNVDFSNIAPLSEEQDDFTFDPSELESQLSQLEELTEEALGSDGWEIAGAFDASGKFHYYFGKCSLD